MKRCLPELELLVPLLGPKLAERIASESGGWRSLSLYELESLGLSDEARQKVLALQALVRSTRPRLPVGKIGNVTDVARIYEGRIGGLEHEELLAVALDGQNRVLSEVPLASGGCGSLSVTPADVFRPLIRDGARAFVLVHNHPSGRPEPSADDVRMTRLVAQLAAVVGIELLDHVVVTTDDHRSIRELGIFESEGEMHEFSASKH